MIEANAIGGYRELARHLQSRINAGEYQTGSRLPAEIEMSRWFGLNRHTVRAALQELEKDGYIYRVRGKGTFVALRRIPYAITPGTSFTAAVEKLGLEGGTKVLRASIMPARGEVAKHLKLDNRAEIVSLEIVRSIEGAPVSATTSCLPLERFPNLAEDSRAIGSLYKLLRQKYGVTVISRAWSEIEAAVPEARDREALQMPMQMPVLVARSLVLDGEKKPIEYCVSRYRSDAYTLRIDLQNQGTGEN